MTRTRKPCRECARPCHAQGLCTTHYTQLRKSGSFVKVVPASREDRFWSRVTVTGSCWLWSEYLNRQGYGYFRDGDQSFLAHRVAYETLVGPTDLPLDHLCRNPSCVNPDHLEPVTSRENTLRGFGPAAQNARKSHCVRGHDLTDAYVLRGKRYCNECRRLKDRGELHAWQEVSGDE